MILWRNDKEIESKNTQWQNENGEKLHWMYFKWTVWLCNEKFSKSFSSERIWRVSLHKQSQAFGTGRIHYIPYTYIHYTATLNWKLCEFRPTLSFGSREKNSCIAMNPTQAHSRCLAICWTKKINFITFACHSKFVMLKMAILSTRPQHITVSMTFFLGIMTKVTFQMKIHVSSDAASTSDGFLTNKEMQFGACGGLFPISWKTFSSVNLFSYIIQKKDKLYSCTVAV